jgi:pimeloyl-ACP methyl ester carboxylesterase
MKKIVFISLAIFILLSLSGCQSLWYLFLKVFVDIAPDRFTIEEQNEKLSIPIYSSHPLIKEDNEVEYLILIVHGAGLNASKTFETGQKIVESLKIAKSRVMVVAPQFLEGVDPNEKGLLLWDRRWRSGGKFLSNDLNKSLPELSSYEVLDTLIYVITKRNPNLRRAIILGHSAGGQFVLRYAALNNNHEMWARQGVLVQYIVSNSSSYLYLDETRYQYDSKERGIEIPRGELMNCPGYNKYKYGLEELYGYAETLSPELIRTRLLTRPIMFLNGAADTDRSWSLDKSCEGDAQGENRYMRWLLYKYHLRHFVKDSIKSQLIWLEIPDVGHNSTEMFNHPKFIKTLKALNF